MRVLLTDPHQPYGIRRMVAVLVLMAIGCNLAAGALADDGTSRLYRTRDEKREAGVRRQWTPWLSTTSLAELEWESEKYSGPDSQQTISEEIATLQLGVKLEPADLLTGELILEYDTELDDLFIDEGALELDFGRWELVLGKYYLPFGEYYSNFFTDPILQLGEVRAYAVSLAHDFGGDTDLSVFAYRSHARPESDSGDKTDFGIAFEARPHEQLLLYLSYLSDLADSDEKILEDQNNRYARKVPGVSGQVLWLSEDYEVSFEALAATKQFKELDPDRNQPFAWNLEFVYAPHPQIDLTLRIEGSKEIEDAPKLRYGLAFNARIHRNVSFTLEALHGRFADDLAVADDDEPFTHINTLAAQVVIAF